LTPKTQQAVTLVDDGLLEKFLWTDRHPHHWRCCRWHRCARSPTDPSE